MKNIKKTIALGLVAAATAFGFTANSHAGTVTVKVGQTVSLSCLVSGKYVIPSSVTVSPAGSLTVTKYKSLSSGKYYGKATAKKAGSATIKVKYGKKYYYHYINIVANSGTQSGTTPKSLYIDGESKVSVGRYGLYTLKGKSGGCVTSGIKWKLTGASSAITGLLGYSSYAKLVPYTKKASEVLTIKATYNGVTYTKKVTVLKSGTYGILGSKALPPRWVFCTTHGWYNANVGLGGCPGCIGTF